MTTTTYQNNLPRNLRAHWALAALLGFLASCGGGDSRQPVANLPPPPTSRPPANVNIDSPVLTMAGNSPVSSVGALTTVWSDEFNLAQLGPKTWHFESGDGSQYGIRGWGNNELPWYLPDSAELRNVSLAITARMESRNGMNYTSARIKTQDRFAFRYRRIDARMKSPNGQGP